MLSRLQSGFFWWVYEPIVLAFTRYQICTGNLQVGISRAKLNPGAGGCEFPLSYTAHSRTTTYSMYFTAARHLVSALHTY